MSETTLHEAMERIDSLTAALRDTNENFLNARDHAEAAEARAQKAENEHRVMNNRLFELRDRAQKAEAVVEAQKVVLQLIDDACRNTVTGSLLAADIRAHIRALTAYEPPNNDLWAAWNRCPICEGLDQPGLIHNPQAPYCSQREQA